eukprot:gene512-3838_t
MAELRDQLRPKKAQWLAFLEDVADDGIYNDKIEEMIQKGKNRLFINLNDVRRKNQDLARQTLEAPMLDVTAAQLALKELVDTKDATFSSKQGSFFVGFSGSFGGHHVTPRGLSAHLLGKLVCIDGIVSKCSLVHPKVVKSVHYCPATKLSTERTYRDATSIDGLPTYGLYPRQDDMGNPLVTEYGYSVYKNHQRITIQEMPERAPAGQLPRSVDVILDDDLVDCAKPGDRVQIVGIYRALPSKRNGTTSGVFRTVLLANTVRLLEAEVQMPSLTDTDIKNILKISKTKRKNLTPFRLLARSLAPSIYGSEEIKMGILCLLLGGLEKNLKRGGHIRGDINILMVGDPSCGKSQLLRFVHNTAPHCITTTGRGSSGVGLTAAVTTDQDTGERRLEAGAMVLADRGIVCIDEFDKMSDIDRVAIHEVMEQQTVTIAKAGIHTSLNARCSVLAAANPVYGQYDPYSTPTDNIGLPDSLLSRFDLLFIMLDKMDPEVDSKLASHVLNSHIYRNPGETDGEPLHMETSSDVIIVEPVEDADPDEQTDVWSSDHPAAQGRQKKRRFLNVEFVQKYIMYARARCQPILGEEAAEFIADAYASLRSREHDEKTLPVTARTLETMIRLSTSHAKTVEREDAEVAMDLINFAYYNEAKPLERPRKRRHSDRDPNSDDDDDSDDDGNRLPSQRTTLTAQHTSPRKGIRRTQEESDPSQTAFSRKPVHDTSASTIDTSEDPYNFDSVTAPDSTPAAKRPKHATIDGSSSEVAAAEVEHESESIPVQQHEAGSTQVSPDDMAAFKTAVLSVYKDLRYETVQMTDLQQQLKTKGLNLSENEIRDRLVIMQEENLVYVSDNTIFLV